MTFLRSGQALILGAGPAGIGDRKGDGYVICSDTTPDVTFSYDRLGRQETVTDGVGSRSFAYNLALQLKTEAIINLDNMTITRNDNIGRGSGFTLGDDYSVTYDNSGRFDNVSWNADGQTEATYRGQGEAKRGLSCMRRKGQQRP